MGQMELLRLFQQRIGLKPLPNRQPAVDEESDYDDEEESDEDYSLRNYPPLHPYA